MVWKYERSMHFTGVQAQATNHWWCESMNARCILPGSKLKQQATDSVKVQMLDVFYQKNTL